MSLSNGNLILTRMSAGGFARHMPSARAGAPLTGSPDRMDRKSPFNSGKMKGLSLKENLQVQTRYNGETFPCRLQIGKCGVVFFEPC